MTHGEGGGKRPTLTKHKMSACARSFKASSGAFLAKNVNWFEMEKFLLLWVKCKVGFISLIFFIIYVW
jgi:hypothetical protein